MPDLGDAWVKILLALVIGFTSIALVRELSGWFMRLVIRPPKWLETEAFRPPGEDTRFVRRLTTLERFTTRAYSTIAVAGMLIYIAYVLDLRLYGILAGAGIVGIAVAFGAQAIIRDAISGIFILIENPYDIGDYIRLNAIEGEVVGISLRHTTLLGDEGTVHTIPNGAVTLTSNYTRDATTHTLLLRVAADVPYERLSAVVDEVAQRVATAPEIGERVMDGPRLGGVTSFRSDSYEVEIRTRMHRSLRRTWPPMLNRQLQQALAEAEINVL